MREIMTFDFEERQSALIVLFFSACEDVKLSSKGEKKPEDLPALEIMEGYSLVIFVKNLKTSYPKSNIETLDK